VELWPSQLEQATLIHERPYVFIAAEMGTGKTAAVISGLVSCRRVLVLCPIAVGPAWVKQLGLWDGQRKSCLLVEGKDRHLKLAEFARSSGYVILNYDSCWRPKIAKELLKQDWDAIVLDESHKVKSPSGRASRFLAKLGQAKPKAKRVCMTGTPCPHSPLDWWGQFRFLDPEVLGGSYTKYRARIANTHPKYPGWVTGFKKDALEALAARIKPHVHQVRLDDIISLPDKFHIDVPVILENQSVYDKLEEDFIAELGGGDAIVATNAMVLTTRLQQVTSGFISLEGGGYKRFEESKKRAFKELVEDIPPGEPIVVFCKFHADLDACLAVFEELKIPASELSGRRKQLDSWQRGDTLGLVVQQATGGAGVDCTRSSYCVYYSLSHSLGDFDQSVARVRRPGQSRVCRFYHLVCENTIDRSIYDALSNKRDVVESVMERLKNGDR